MKTKRIIKFLVSIVMVLILLFSVSMPIYAFPASDDPGTGIGITIGLSLVLILSPFFLLIGLIEAVFSGSGNILAELSEAISDYLSMFGL